MMVEVPAAALTIADFDAAFFSIGSNDLAQYRRRRDRSNGAVEPPADPLRPGVLELIRASSTIGGRAEKHKLVRRRRGGPALRPGALELRRAELSMSPNSISAVWSAIGASAQETPRG